MTERALIAQKALELCDNLWQRGDFWNFESLEYERARCTRLLTILAGRHCARALEISCGAGYFTRLLAGIAADRVRLRHADSRETFVRGRVL